MSYLKTVTLLIWLIANSILYLLLLLFERNLFFYRYISKIFAFGILKISGMQLKSFGLEKIDIKKKYIFIANHSSYLDIPCMMVLIPQTFGIIYKRELHFIPFFGLALKYSRAHIPIERKKNMSAMQSLEIAAEKIRNGNSILLFAEGTRSLDGNLQKFKRGPFYLALKSGVEVVPVTINGTFRIFPKNSLKVNSGIVEIIFDSPIKMEMQNKNDEMKLMELVKNSIEKNYKLYGN